MSYTSIGNHKFYPLIHGASVQTWAPLTEGYGFQIGVIVPAGYAGGATFEVQSAPADPLNECVPDATKWTDVIITPECDSNAVATPWILSIDAATPPDAFICEFSYDMCNAPFIRLVPTAATGLTAFVMVDRLRKTGA
jgi:hypothetical protein